MRHQLLVLLICINTCRVLSNSCSSPQECSPIPIAQDSIQVRCIDNVCVCNSSCFYLSSDSSPPCVLNSACYTYSPEVDSCTLVSKRLTDSIIFALFLGYAGAANYYVGRYTLAIIQSVLLVVVISWFCCLCAFNAYILYKTNDVDTDPRCLMYLGIIGVLVLLVLSACSFTWWFVDIFLFATNSNLDGNGCPLSLS